MRVGACEHRDFSLYESRQYDTDDKLSAIQFFHGHSAQVFWPIRIPCQTVRAQCHKEKVNIPVTAADLKQEGYRVQSVL